MKKIILHLCADLGSDSYPYQLDPDYEVIKIGKEIGVENYHPPKGVHGIIANPPCTEFSRARANGMARGNVIGVEILNHCLRIIKEVNNHQRGKPLAWWYIENPASGDMGNALGKPNLVYQPWEYGSPWTKKTALWGRFQIPEKLYKNWDDVPKNAALYQRPGRGKPSLAFLHKSAIDLIPEFAPFKDHVKTDADLRSLCSQGFARAFKEVNQ